MAVRVGVPSLFYYPGGMVSAGEDSITASIEELGLTRRVRLSDGAHRIELCCYTAAAITTKIAVKIGVNVTNATKFPEVTALAANDGSDTLTRNLIGIPQQAITAAGYYWFAVYGTCEFTAGTGGVAAEDALKALDDEAGKLTADAGDYNDAQSSVHTVGVAIDTVAADATGTCVLLGGEHAIDAA